MLPSSILIASCPSFSARPLSAGPSAPTSTLRLARWAAARLSIIGSSKLPARWSCVRSTFERLPSDVGDLHALDLAGRLLSQSRSLRSRARPARALRGIRLRRRALPRATAPLFRAARSRPFRSHSAVPHLTTALDYHSVHL